MSIETKLMICDAVKSLEDAVDSICFAVGHLTDAGDVKTAEMCVPAVTAIGEIMRSIRDRAR